eukprot:1680049-Prymnesium_polylepis.1
MRCVATSPHNIATRRPRNHTITIYAISHAIAKAGVAQPLVDVVPLSSSRSNMGDWEKMFMQAMSQLNVRETEDQHVATNWLSQPALGGSAESFNPQLNPKSIADWGRFRRRILI